MENKYLQWHYKVIHYVISKNIIPSSEPPLKIHEHEATILRAVADGLPDRHPKIIMQNIITTIRGTIHPLPYPHLIKRIMVKLGLYRPTRGEEVRQFAYCSSAFAASETAMIQILRLPSQLSQWCPKRPPERIKAKGKRQRRSRQRRPGADRP